MNAEQKTEWVWVPREPTKEMVQASDEISCRAEGAEHWAAMLAAAPSPPAETSNARGEVVAWFPTNAQGEIIRNYRDGSPVYACRTKEEAEQAKRCHLGATGPVIPLYAAPPPADAEARARELLAQEYKREGLYCGQFYGDSAMNDSERRAIRAIVAALTESRNG